MKVLLANIPIALLTGFLCWLGTTQMTEHPVLAWVLVGVGAALGFECFHVFRKASRDDEDKRS